MFARHEACSNKNAYWDVNNRKWRKWCKLVSPFLFNNTYGLPVITMDMKCPNQVFYVSLVDLYTICAKLGLETWLFPNNDIRKCLLDKKHIWIKNAFWDVNNKKWSKWCLFHLSYLITLMAYQCSNGHQVSKSSILCLIGRSTEYLC
jgi:hypothetical protein